MNDQSHFKGKGSNWIFCLILFLFAGTNQQLFAQQPAYFILGEEQFKGVQIYDIIQDNDNNYWISTDEGIYLYDFYLYKKIEADNAKSNAVFHFVKSKNGTIYCHNIVNQIFQIKNKECRLFYEIPASEASPNVQLETTDKDNLVIVSKGITVVNPKGKRILFHRNISESIALIGKFNNGSIHFKLKESDKILILQSAKFSVKKISNFPENGQLQFISNGVNSIVINRTENQIFDYNFDKYSLEKQAVNSPFNKEQVIRFYPTKDKIWAATSSEGIQLFSNSLIPKFSHPIFNNYFISEIYEDHEGNILLGTFDNGIIVVPDLNVSGVIDPYTQNEVLSLYSDKDLGLIFGTNQGEIYTRKKGIYKTLIQPSQLNSNEIEGIYGSEKAPFIIFGNKSIQAFFKNTGKLTKIIDASLKDLVFISNNQFYLATNRGLYLVKFTTGNQFECALVNDIDYRIYALAYDELTSSLYISSAKGLLRLNANKLEVIKYQNQELFIDDFSVTDGIVCAASRKFGIIKFKNNQISGVIRPMIDGQLESVNKFMFSNHSLFAATDNGFFQFTENGELTNSLHTSNSFASKRVFDFTLEGNNLWVSHFGGVQRLNVNYQLPESPAVKLYISKILFNNKEVHSLHEMDGKQEKIQFFLSLPTLRNRNNAHYYYKLDGYDEFWQIAPYEENSITYNALSPGEYNLKIRFENAGKNSKTIHYSFTISQPFYLTWWFISLAILFGIVLVYFIYQSAKNQEKQKTKHFEKIFDLRIKNLQQQISRASFASAFQITNDLNLKGKMDNSMKFAELFAELNERYLQQSTVDFISLEQETINLNLFLELEKIKDPAFDFNITSNVDKAVEIPVFSILPFLEELMMKEFRGKNGPKKLEITFNNSTGLQVLFEHNIIGNTDIESNYSSTFKEVKTKLEVQQSNLLGSLTYTIETEKIEGFVSSAKLDLILPIRSIKASK